MSRNKFYHSFLLSLLLMLFDQRTNRYAGNHPQITMIKSLALQIIKWHIVLKKSHYELFRSCFLMCLT